MQSKKLVLFLKEVVDIWEICLFVLLQDEI